MKHLLSFGLILIAPFFAVCNKTNAQSPSYEWVKAIGGANYDIGNAIAVDQETGDVYATGVFSRTIDFDPGRDVYNLTAAGGNDIFISKTNSSGRFVWALRIGGDLNDFGFSIAIDPSGSVYVTGQFGKTVDFDPGEGVFNLTSAGSSDIYILKLDTSGNFIWAKTFEGTGYDVVKALAVDPSGSGEVYIKGEFNETVDFDPGVNTFTLTNFSSRNGVFISKLDALGNFAWAIKLDVDPFCCGIGIAPFGGLGKSIIVDASGNVYTSGWFHGTADLDSGEGVYNLTATGVNDIFILKLNTHGKFVWAKSMPGGHQSFGHSMAVDVSGNVYTSGSFQGTVDFNPGRGTYPVTCRGRDDAFISKLDCDGNFIWAKVFGGAQVDSGNSIEVDPKSGDIYSTGIFAETADFDPGKGIYNLTSAGAHDVFISKLDAYGNFVWAKAIGGINVDYGYSIALGSSGNIHVIGGFTGPSISFGPTPLPNTDSTGHHLDIFMAKLNASIPVSIANINANSVFIYPSPAKDELKIKFNDDELMDAKITMINPKGEVVYSSANKNSSQELTIDISDLPATNYFIAIDNNENRLVKQVVKIQD